MGYKSNQPKIPKDTDGGGVPHLFLSGMDSGLTLINNWIQGQTII